MIISGCPGSKQIKEPVPEVFECPVCGAEVEIWTHEISRNCDKCGNLVTKEKLPSCIDWCVYAVDCVGPEILKMFKKKKDQNEEDSKGIK